jgi:hypothetical protein
MRAIPAREEHLGEPSNNGIRARLGCCSVAGEEEERKRKEKEETKEV